MRALHAVFLAACIPHLASSRRGSMFARRPEQEQQQEHYDERPRRLAVAVTNSDEYASTVVSVEAPPSKSAPGIKPHEYARITEALSRVNELVDLARRLFEDKNTIGQGREIMERAQRRFLEVQDLIVKVSSDNEKDNNDDNRMLRKKYSNHDINEAREDETRALDVARQVVQSRLLSHDESGQISFPECMHLFTNQCQTLINKYLREHGLKSRINIQVVEKRTSTGEGFNKVVIITDATGSKVDVQPEYPFKWDGADIGPWPTCVGMAPTDCCLTIRNDITNMYRNEYIECQFFTPKLSVDNYSSWLPSGRTAVAPAVTYEAAEDAVVMIESPDGRVHELPVLQTTTV